MDRRKRQRAAAIVVASIAISGCAFHVGTAGDVTLTLGKSYIDVDEHGTTIEVCGFSEVFRGTVRNLANGVLGFFNREPIDDTNVAKVNRCGMFYIVEDGGAT